MDLVLSTELLCHEVLVTGRLQQPVNFLTPSVSGQSCPLRLLMAHPEGFEPPTLRFVAARSIQLS